MMKRDALQVLLTILHPIQVPYCAFIAAVEMLLSILLLDPLALMLVHQNLARMSSASSDSIRSRARGGSAGGPFLRGFRIAIVQYLAAS